MTDRPELKERLGRIADDAAHRLDQDRKTDAWRRALESAAPLLLAVPLAALALGLLRSFGGFDLKPLPFGWICALTPLPAIAFVVHRIRATWRRPTTRGAALGRLDDKGELGDRLANAWEFLGRDTQGPFVDAALADAEAHLDRADRVPVGGASAALALAPRDLLCAGGALAALAILPFLGATSTDEEVSVNSPDDVVAVAERGEPRRETRDVTPVTREERPARPQPAKTKKPEAGGESRSQSRQDDQPLSRDLKKTRGEVGKGRSADASSSSGSSEARGMPTDQAQASESSKKKTKKKKKKKDRGAKKAEAPPKKKPSDESGATAGRGAASGSNKSPAQSTWKSKDQVVSDDEEDLEDDEEVDDEFEDNEARGGVQPQLRDRKPPVNRDLGIGFGNRANPDANGRGGPSEQKKSRGVASLVLGVPIPDHVKGRPNPGKTKITQERVEPREDRGTVTQASSRPKRDEVTGQGARPALDPWLRTLVRDYFEARRRADARSEKVESTQ